MNEPDVLFEDDDILVVNKPPGLAVHEDGRTEERTLTDWVRAQYPHVVGVGEEMTLQNGKVIDRPGIVHRLDRNTSGVLLLAKNQTTFLFLKEQFKNREIKKLYHAFVWGEIREPHGTIDKPIGRSRKDFRLWSAGPSAGGRLREAVTRWTLLMSKNGFSYLALEPKTGRTHQIRVHLKAIGHPVVGDTRYAPEKGTALSFERLALHAHMISFIHPNGDRMEIEAPLPQDFKNALALFEGKDV
ncbi:TPA: RluA family pseudouridine synthase [Patescibacteria group bacterium]|nr:MAG: Pseudouridine synthase, RluA family [Parcubacteria group bacterium GW2011_GWD2_42_14]HCC05541.1 RluA family pseudouridine synthase [Patescibacteria group bacterium]